ncbi:hypothetical protein [Massilia sp. PWRC2]|uniref:hypothetical protein n=1 Tax=Massilia sp. PWRC2 TaxID=2804626 RepID=UPI003CF646FC
MKHATSLMVAAAAALLAAAAAAEPAPWYKWRSNIDGAVVCAQTPLGAGWEKAAGPYRDSHCTRPAPQRR